jgi:formate-dependent nitrite reductase membrane component NrfD
MPIDNDLILVIGIVLGALAIPSLLSAFSESRAPRAGAILVLLSGVLIAVALSRQTTGYSFSEIPDVFLRVIGRYTN